MHFVALEDTLAQTLAEVEVEKPGVTLDHVKALALVDVLAYTLAGNKRRTPGKTRSGDAA